MYAIINTRRKQTDEMKEGVTDVLHRTLPKYMDD